MQWRLRLAYLLVAPSLVLAGWFWMHRAATHFEHVTGRPFYGLAGYHYSMPEWGFKYDVGGERIERWVVTVPTLSTLSLFLVASLIMTATERHRGVTVVVLGWIYHLVFAIAFVLVSTWYSINVMGVFV